MLRRPHIRSISGFSLVELSIVLVIVGLLVGGILTGKSLIKAAELRKIVADMREFQSAGETFENKYGELPGDFDGATRYWGRETSNADCVTNSSASVNSVTGACDGSGDGSINTSASASGASAEELQFWRHLSQAGMLAGNYTGLGTSDSNYITGGVNAPNMGYKNGVWRIYNMGDLSGTVTGSTTTTFALNFGIVLHMTVNSGSQTLTPEDAWFIDKKADDGMPGAGLVVARPWSACTTASDRTDLTATYALSTNDTICGLQRRLLFL